MDYLEKRSMNGVVLKAYTNLYNKGKNVNTDTLKKKENLNKVKKEDVYNQVYFRKENKEKNSRSVKYFHPFLAED
jgi:hypothetical protein